MRDWTLDHSSNWPLVEGGSQDQNVVRTCHLSSFVHCTAIGGCIADHWTGYGELK